MAYNKVSNKAQNRDIKYISKDYGSFKTQLLEFAKIYFPDKFNDFSEISTFGAKSSISTNNCEI